MTRGNQRETDRARAAARTAKANAGKNTDGMTPEQRRERDKKALEEKLAKKAAGGGEAQPAAAKKGKS